MRQQSQYYVNNYFGAKSVGANWDSTVLTFKAETLAGHLCRDHGFTGNSTFLLCVMRYL